VIQQIPDRIAQIRARPSGNRRASHADRHHVVETNIRYPTDSSLLGHRVILAQPTRRGI
jgi:hypothetical protein